MIPKNFLFVSLEGLISDVAWQVVKEGHNVKYFIDSKDEKAVADGFVPKTEDWEKDVEWADVIVFDDVLGQGEKAQKLRQQGKLVVGGTPYTDKLEDDRGFGQNELKKAGVPIIPQENFTSFDEAIEYVKKNPNKYVIKPSGEAQNVKQLLFVGEEEDGKDIIHMLEDYKATWSNRIKEFQLQRKINGVEVAVGAFFNGYEFMQPINVNFEHKKLFPGNIGPSTGEMGTSMFFSEPNRIFSATLKKMESVLRREKYVGYIDINCIVNNNGIYPLEFTSRFGYPTISIQQEGILMPSSDKNILLLKLDNGYNAGFIKKEVSKITVLTKAAAKKKAASKVVKNPHLPTIAILHTGGTIASKVDYRTGGVASEFSPEELLSLFLDFKNFLSSLTNEKIIEIREAVEKC